MNQAQRMLALVAAFQLLSAAAWAVDAPPPAPAPPLVRVKIVAFNDFHGNLESPGTFGENTTVPSAQRPAVGGAEYLAAYIATMKAGNPNTVVLGGGDFVGATPLISALFYDEPAVEALNKIGVDFSAVGNHEFDKGSAECACCRTAAARCRARWLTPIAAAATARQRRAASTAPSSSGCRPT